MSPGRWQCPCFQAESEEVVVLEYSHCNLDDVPSEVFTFERTLEELYLDANQIKDLPRALFHCHGLRKLVLSDNEVQSLPPAIASLINLEELDVSKNGVLEIPDNIKGCKCLSIIEASVNPLGRLPEGFTQLANLSELYLNDTFLEYLPANFGRLCHLRILELRENHLKVLPKSMARLTELSRLDIGQNDFAELPEVMGSLQKLTELWCDGNRILRIPAHLGHLKKLSYLDASKNRIQEVSPEIDGCLSMTDLTLSSNKIKDLPHTIGNLKKLLVLRVDNNHLGSLPPSLGNLQLLEELVVSFNVLTNLPASLGLLRLLHTLIADDNCLEDLPQVIGSCISLSILSVRNNRLSFVPDELGHIGRLRVINLVGNRLCHLPFSIAKLPCLHALWLAENQAKPLIPLQSDIDQASGQRVLTCFMLPQSPVDRDGEPTTPDSEAEREVRQQIKFASDIESDRPGKLVRAPTPYPKELKAHARHARNFVLKKLEANGALPLDKSMTNPEVEDASVVTPNERSAVREAKVTKSPKDVKATGKEIGLDLTEQIVLLPKETTKEQTDCVNPSQLDAMEDMLQAENICCNGGVSGGRSGSISVSGAPMAALDSSPSPSPQSHTDSRVIYANICARRASGDMDAVNHTSRPQSRCDPPVGGVMVLPSVHGQQQQLTSPDSDSSSLTVQGHHSVMPGQRSPRSSVASSPHGSLTPGSNGMTISSASGSCRVSVSSNNPYSGCMSPQSGGESSDVSHYGSSTGSRTQSSQQGVANRMTACSGIAWYTEPPPMHHVPGAQPLMHHQHAHHHLRQGQAQGEPMRPYSRGSYSETVYSALSRGEGGGGPRGGSPVNVVQHALQGARWGGPNPTDKRNSFPLARQNSADMQGTVPGQ